MNPFSNYSFLGKIFIGERFGKMTHLVPVVLVRDSIKHVPNEIVKVTVVGNRGIIYRSLSTEIVSSAGASPC